MIVSLFRCLHVETPSNLVSVEICCSVMSRVILPSAEKFDRLKRDSLSISVRCSLPLPYSSEGAGGWTHSVVNSLGLTGQVDSLRAQSTRTLGCFSSLLGPRGGTPVSLPRLCAGGGVNLCHGLRSFITLRRCFTLVLQAFPLFDRVPQRLHHNSGRSSRNFDCIHLPLSSHCIVDHPLI